MGSYNNIRQVGKRILEFGIIVGVVGVIGISVIGFDILTRHTSPEYLETKVRETANTNNDKRTSMEEWSRVYEELGIYFDELHPRKISVKEMRRYLDNHKVEY